MMRMKKILNILLAAAFVFTAFSCDVIPQPDKDASGSQYLPGPALEILSKTVVFSPDGGNGSIVVNTNDALTARVDRPWISVSTSGSTVSLTVSRNESIESRYATVTLRAGDAVAEITAQQFGINSAYMWDESYTFPYPGGTLDLPYGEPGTVWVDVSLTKWVSASVDDANCQIHFTVAPSIYNYERKCTVPVTIGENYVRELVFIQEANPAGLNPGDPDPIEFKVQSAWTPKYIEPESDDDPTTKVGVDVAEGADGGHYFVRVVSQAEFVTAGSDEQLFLNRNASAWAAESPQTYRASMTEEIEKLENGNYRIYAIGVGNDNTVNGTYAVATFKVAHVLSAYEKFLGTWRFVRGTAQDTWTVTEKVKNQSYTITGIDGIDDIEVEALFNAADGSVSVNAQKNLGEHTVNTSSGSATGQACLYGNIMYQGEQYYVSYSTQTYMLFNITFDAGANTGTLAPGKASTTVGDFDLIGFCLYTITSDGKAYSVIDQAPLPNTITHLTWSGGSGDGDDPDEPVEGAYGKWIGTWNAGSGRTITVAEYEAGSSYLVTDSGYGGFEYQSWLDEKTGEMLFRTHVVEEDGIDLYYFIGVDGNSLRPGSEDDDFLIARGSLSADGSSASIKGITYMAEDQNGSTFEAKVAAVTILDYQTEDGGGYDKGWYGLTGIEDLALPANLTKASSSSTLSVARSGYLDLDRGKFIKPARSVNRQKARRIQ